MQGTALIGIMLAASLVAPFGQAGDESADELVSRANRLVAEGAYAEALEAYELASELKPDAPEVSFNRGVALYRLGDYNAAAEAF